MRIMHHAIQLSSAFQTHSHVHFLGPSSSAPANSRLKIDDAIYSIAVWQATDDEDE